MKKAEKIDYLLQHLNSLLTRSSDQILLRELGIGYSQYKILRALSSGPSVKQRDIAENLGQTEASISRQIDLMSKGGLVSKLKDPNNKRAHIILVTIKGDKLTDSATKLLNKFYDQLFENVRDNKKDLYLDTLTDLHNLICQIDHFPDKTELYNP